jgi:hypothetical protein
VPAIHYASRFKARRRASEQLAFEEVNQLDDQDDDHRELEEKCAALVELVDHEAVELFGGVDLAGDKVFVIGHADFERGQAVKARGKHVA